MPTLDLEVARDSIRPTPCGKTAEQDGQKRMRESSFGLRPWLTGRLRFGGKPLPVPPRKRAKDYVDHSDPSPSVLLRRTHSRLPGHLVDEREQAALHVRRGQMYRPTVSRQQPFEAVSAKTAKRGPELRP